MVMSLGGRRQSYGRVSLFAVGNVGTYGQLQAVSCCSKEFQRGQYICRFGSSSCSIPNVSGNLVDVKVTISQSFRRSLAAVSRFDSNFLD